MSSVLALISRARSLLFQEDDNSVAVDALLQQVEEMLAITNEATEGGGNVTPEIMAWAESVFDAEAREIIEAAERAPKDSQ